jgi:hypothetical protein
MYRVIIVRIKMGDCDAGNGAANPSLQASLVNESEPNIRGTDAEKLLVVSYWFQVVQGTTELESLTLNKELKNLGHPVGNITRAFAGLAQAVPRLVIQTRKTGSTRQARKRFKLTVEGIRRVGQLLGEAHVGVAANAAGDGVAPQ